MEEKKYFTKEAIEETKKRDLKTLDKFAGLIKHAAAIGAGELLVNEPEVFDLAYPWFKYARDFAETKYQDAKEVVEFNYELTLSTLERTEAVNELKKQNEELIELLRKGVSNNSSEHKEMTKLIVAKKEK